MSETASQSPAARSASSTPSTTSACCSWPATASRPSTSCCRRRSPTRAASSPGSPAFWFAQTESIVPNHLIALRDGRPLDRVPAARDAPDRMRRPRLPRRVRLEGLPRERRGLRPPAARRASRVRSGCPSRSSRRRRRRRPATTRTSTAPRPSRSSARSASTRSSGSRSSSTASSPARALERGIILADTKLEFGVDDQGRLVLADEAFTPDSSRFWPADEYAPAGRSRRSTSSSSATTARRSAGTRPTPGPELPADVVDGTRARYIEAFERLTGSTSPTTSPIPRWCSGEGDSARPAEAGHPRSAGPGGREQPAAPRLRRG